MAISKKNRELIFNKYGGRCAYCGCELAKGWHVDELKPCRRLYKWVRVPGEKRWVQKFKGYAHPERLHLENQMPACPSCNINKHQHSLEAFRKLIEGFIKSLNRDSTQYKIAKRYGLIEETIKPVLFYFETYEDADESNKGAD